MSALEDLRNCARSGGLECRAVAQAVAPFRRENEVLRSNSDHLSAENASLVRQVESMAMRIESLAEELAKPEDVRLREVLDALDGRAVIFDGLGARVGHLLDEMDDWIERAGAAERRLKNAEERIRELEAECKLAHAAAQEAHGSCFAQIESWKGRAEKAEARVKELEGDLHASYDRGRAQGRVDVGKYSRAFGEIEKCLGMAGAVPLSQTVGSVRALKERVRELEAELDKLRSSRGLYLVTDADMRVLEAIEAVPETWLKMAVGSSQITRGLAALAAAELARREEKTNE